VRQGPAVGKVLVRLVSHDLLNSSAKHDLFNSSAKHDLFNSSAKQEPQLQRGTLTLAQSAFAFFAFQGASLTQI